MSEVSRTKKATELGMLSSIIASLGSYLGVRYFTWHLTESSEQYLISKVAMLTSSNDDPALVAKQLNTKQGCISLGAMMGQYKIVDNVLVAVMKKSVPEKKKTANLGRRGRARREEYVYEVPEQVRFQRYNISVFGKAYPNPPGLPSLSHSFQKTQPSKFLSGFPSGVSNSWLKLAYLAGNKKFSQWLQKVQFLD